MFLIQRNTSDTIFFVYMLNVKQCVNSANNKNLKNLDTIYMFVRHEICLPFYQSLTNTKSKSFKILYNIILAKHTNTKA